MRSTQATVQSSVERGKWSTQILHHASLHSTMPNTNGHRAHHAGKRLCHAAQALPSLLEAAESHCGKGCPKCSWSHFLHLRSTTGGLRFGGANSTQAPQFSVENLFHLTWSQSSGMHILMDIFHLAIFSWLIKHVPHGLQMLTDTVRASRLSSHWWYQARSLLTTARLHSAWKTAPRSSATFEVVNECEKFRVPFIQALVESNPPLPLPLHERLQGTFLREKVQMATVLPLKDLSRIPWSTLDKLPGRSR